MESDEFFGIGTSEFKKCIFKKLPTDFVHAGIDANTDFRKKVGYFPKKWMKGSVNRIFLQDLKDSNAKTRQNRMTLKGLNQNFERK